MANLDKSVEGINKVLNSVEENRVYLHVNDYENIGNTEGDTWIEYSTDSEHPSICVKTSTSSTSNDIAKLDANDKLDIDYIPDSIASGLKYQTTYNADTGLPELPSPSATTTGYLWIVNTAGTQTLDDVSYELEIGDWIIMGESDIQIVTNEEVPATETQLGSIVISNDITGTHDDIVVKSLRSGSWVIDSSTFDITPDTTDTYSIGSDTNKPLRLYSANLKADVLEFGDTPEYVAGYDSTDDAVALAKGTDITATSRVSVTDDGIYLTGDETSSKSIYFGDDVDATSGKITYSNTDDSVVVSAGGNEILNVIDSKVGVNVAAPVEELDVAGKAYIHNGESGVNTTYVDTLIVDSDSSTFIGVYSADDQRGSLVFRDSEGERGWLSYDHTEDRIRIGTNGSNQLWFTSEGELGLGEVTPLGKVHIQTGDTGITSVSDTADELILESDADSGMTIISGTESLGSIRFGDVDSADRGYIGFQHYSDDSYGGVVVALDDATPTLYVVDNMVGINAWPDVALAVDGEVIVRQPSGDAALRLLSTENGTSTLHFGYNTLKNEASVLYNSSEEYMRIRSTGASIYLTDGNIGINNSEPEYPLDITGHARIMDSSANVYLYMTTGNTNTSAIYFGDEDNTTIGFVGYSHNSDYLYLGAGANTTCYIRNDRLGVNQSNPSYPLDVAGNARLYNGSGSTSLFITASTSSSSILYFGDTSDSTEGWIGYDNSNEYMYIAANGSTTCYIRNDRLGINQASPAYPLDVVGPGRFYNSSGSNYLYIVSSTTTNAILYLGDTSSATRGQVGYSNTSDYLWLGAGAVNTLYIKNDKVGINDSTPSYDLDVKGDARVTDNLYVSDYIGLGTTSPSAKLTISGSGVHDFGNDDYYYVDTNAEDVDKTTDPGERDCSIYGSSRIIGYIVGSFSDIRIKKGIKDYNNALDLIDKINIKSYVKFSEDDEKNYEVGVIAQEVEKVAPFIVSKVGGRVLDDDNNWISVNDFRSVDYNQMSSLAIKGIQELKEENDSMKAEIKDLQEKVEKLLKLL